MELFIYNDLIEVLDESHWYNEYVKELESAGVKYLNIIREQWDGLDELEKLIQDRRYTSIHLDYYFFESNTEFYNFLCMCDGYGIKVIGFEDGTHITDFNNAISMAYLMSGGNQ